MTNGIPNIVFGNSDNDSGKHKIQLTGNIQIKRGEILRDIKIAPSEATVNRKYN